MEHVRPQVEMGLVEILQAALLRILQVPNQVLVLVAPVLVPGVLAALVALVALVPGVLVALVALVVVTPELVLIRFHRNLMMELRVTVVLRSRPRMPVLRQQARDSA